MTTRGAFHEPSLHFDSPADIAIRRWSAGGVAFAILLTAFGGFFSWRSAGEAAEDSSWVAHTNAVNVALAATLAHAIDIETGARGFSATGDEIFLQPYFSGQHVIHSDLDTLTQLIVDSSQQQRLQKLRPQIENGLTIAEELVAERRRTAAVPPIATFARGKQTMDAVRVIIDDMRNQQTSLLARRAQRSEAARRRAASVTFISTVAGILLLFCAGFVTSQQIGQSAKLRGQVQALNSDLEQRVHDRTKALQAEVRVRQRAEDAMRAGERRYRQLFECSSNGICFNEMVFDAEGRPVDFRWLDVNPSYEVLTGLRHEQVSGRCALEILPTLEPYWLDLFNRVVTTGESASFEQLAAPLGRFYQGNAFRTEAGKFAVSFTDVTERRRAEEALRDSGQRLQNIIESAMDAIITVDAEQRIVIFNQAASDMLRCPVAEALGQPLERFIPQRFRGAHASHVRSFGNTETTSRAMGSLGSLRGLRADGVEIHIEASISKVENSGKKLFSVILRDVTEREKAASAMRELAAIVTSSGDAIISKTLEGVVTNWNPGAEFIYGYTAAEMIGQSVTRVVPPDRLDEFRSIMELVRRGERVQNCETVRVHKDGQRIHVALSVSPIRDQTGKLVGASTIARDITERKKAEQTLLENARLLDLTQVLVRDMDSHIVLWNQGSEKLYGFSREEAVGRISHMLLKTQFPEPIEAIDEKLKRTGRWEGELVHRRRDGSVLVVASVWVLHRDPQGHPLHILEANIDVTQKNAAEQEIRKLNNELEHRVHERTAQLEAANKELEAFTYSVSHDLRAPLRHISGFSRMLGEEVGAALSPDAQHYLERIQGGTSRMGMLVDDLLNLGRLGRQPLHLQVAELRPIVDALIDELQPESANRQIEWRIGDLPALDCDPGLLKQVFQNLLANALKFTKTRAPAIIEVGQKEEDGKTIIFVRDNGVGFNMKYSDKLFGVFQRLHRQEDFEGTGVGLATAQRIVQKHGGRIWAEAELEKGAAFYFTISNGDHVAIKTSGAAAGEKS
jgi:PAS domain S-box-containing protein